MQLEKIQQPKTIEQLINPKNLPEAGFQSYREFIDNSSLDQKNDFIDGSIMNPTLNHPRLRDLSGMDQGIIKLGEARNMAIGLENNGDFKKAIASSFDFRAAEMEYIKLLARLEYMRAEHGSEEDIHEVIESARQVGHELYGKPNPEIRDAALNELWAILGEKEYNPLAQKIYNELVNGFEWRGRKMSPMLRSENAYIRLPRFEDNLALEWAGEQVIEQNADIQALVNEFWYQKVVEYGEGYVCHPNDIVEIFQSVIDLRDPNSESGVTVRLDEGKTVLSWESSEMAVLVGSKRAPIKNPDELFRKVLHEFGVHGQRSINGLNTRLPVLGTGLFTDTKRPDYLTFEEGLATTIEEMIGDVVPQWSIAKIGHYLNISMAEAGADFREVYEKAWRYRVLGVVQSGEEVTEEMIEKQKSLAYGSCVRIFRGTQPDLAEATGLEIAPLTFNKDLAYLEGRCLAMRYLETLYKDQDTDGLGRMFAGKFDPTNPEQDRLIKMALLA